MSPELPAPVRLRLAVDDASAAQLATSPLLDPLPGSPRARRLVETYYDTPDFTLTRQRTSLRLRKRRGGFEMVLSQSGEETITPLLEDAPDPALLPPELAELPLAPVLTTDTKTLTRTAGPALVLHFCAGTLATAAGKRKFRELELVQSDGDTAALYATALALAEIAPLRLAAQTQAAHGLVLAGGPPPAVVKSAGGLAGTPSLDEAMQQLSRACLSQFTANWPVFAQGDEVGGVHQMRVSMRRLRSVLGLFNRALPCAEFAAFRVEAKRIATAMGEARNWDVFIALVAKGPASAFPYELGFVPLLAECTHHRQAGYAAVRALLDDPATTRFVLGLEAFLARRGWRNAASPEGLRQLTEPAVGFAAFALHRLHRKVRKRGRHLLRLAPADKHLVRIEMKKLRYAGELFSGLFSRAERLRAYNQAATRLQDQLGVLNDLATALELLGRLDQSDVPRARAAGIVAGWCAHGASADDTALSRSWDEFRGLKPPSE
jgi:inorganic triphosphatase YgiF